MRVTAQAHTLPIDESGHVTERKRHQRERVGAHVRPDCRTRRGNHRDHRDDIYCFGTIGQCVLLGFLQSEVRRLRPPPDLWCVHTTTGRHCSMR